MREKTADISVSRFLLKPGRSYKETVKSFSPYTELKDVWTMIEPLLPGFYNSPS